MMGMMMPETCWVVFKWQVINLRICCIWLVDSVERLLNAIGLPPGGSSTVHIYTQTVHRTTQNKQYVERHIHFGRVRAVPRICGLYPGICLTAEEKPRKNLSRGRLPLPCFSSYDMIYLLTAIGLPPGGSSTVHIYTQTIHRTTQNKQYIGQHKNFGRVRAVPRLCGLYPGICWGKSTEKPQSG